MGKNQGFRCKKCGKKLRDAHKETVFEKRELSLGFHITSTRSQRHLTKPLVRYGLEKKGIEKQTMISSWHG
jgi:tRNA(Ile2)-agmatinylcytidine synthase